MATLIFRILLLTLVTSSWASRAGAGICVNVDLHSDSPNPSTTVIETLKREATAIWRPYGVELRWGAPTFCVEDESLDLLLARHPREATIGQIVLGSTHVRMDRIERAPIVVDYDATAQTLASLTSGALSTVVGLPWLGPQDMGRALGRVAAHEMGHVLLALPKHQRDGLMRAAFQASEMVSPSRARYRLSASEVGRLRFRAEWMAAIRMQSSGGS
jgi:hypothetical protein